MKEVGKLRAELLTIAKYGSALAVLSWDQEVNLPPKAHHVRGEVSALLAADLHRRTTDPKLIDLAKSLAKPVNLKKLSADEQVIVRETWRDLERAQKLPVKFVEDFTKLTAEAFAAWAEARQKSDFSIFKPKLKRIVDMSRRQAEYLGYKDSPYDALLDAYEPGMTAKQLDGVLLPLADELKNLVSRVKEKAQPVLPKRNYTLNEQKKLNQQVSEAIGYDFGAGRIDASPHPFTINFHPTDVRITTRYDKSDFWISLGSVIHEVGHALYEQGLPPKMFGTPLGESISLGIHESQSRIWENFVGRSRAFSAYLYPLLKGTFGQLPYEEEELFRWLNKIRPSLIRVEADEVTYNLHIALRYEIEKALIEKRLDVDDLPAVWNEKVKQYLGIDVPDDAQGVLQDIHWSHGTLGYFPTYSLGNLYAAQIFNTINREIKGLDQKFASGDFEPFLHWLRQNIHRHGRRYRPNELIQKITGEPLDPRYLIEHLKQKVELQVK